MTLEKTIEKGKDATKFATELSKDGKDLYNSVKTAQRSVSDSKKLWREGNKSRLIQIGIACIAFPEPTPISPIIGASLIAAGAIQKGIRNQSLYLNDIKKTCQQAMKEMQSIRLNMH